MPTLSGDVVRASEAVKKAYLQKVDPTPAPPPPAAVGDGNAPPPPPPSGGARVLQAYWRDDFFKRLNGLLTPPKGVKFLQGVNDPACMDFGGWFNYFFSEGRGGNLTEIEIPLGRIFSLVVDLDDVLEVNVAGKQLQRKATKQPPYPLAPAFAALLGTAPDKAPLGVLQYLLELGFKTSGPATASDVSMNTETKDTASGKLVEVEHSFSPYFALKSALTEAPAERASKGEFVFAYRGDSRDPATVVRQKGAKCRVNLDFWRRDASVDKHWHPWFAADSGRTRMWLRNGSHDNDYFTVNSIAMDFHISCAYPMFRVNEVDSSLSGNVNDWTEAEIAVFRRSGKGDVCSIFNRAHNRRELALYDITQVYVCLLPQSTDVARTYEAHGVGVKSNYPESGMRDIPLDRMVACFKVRRFHVGPPRGAEGLSNTNGTGAGRSDRFYDSTQANGVAMTIEVLGWQWVNSAESGRNALGLARPELLKTRMDAEVDKTFDITHTDFVKRSDTFFNPRMFMKLPPGRVKLTV